MASEKKKKPSWTDDQLAAINTHGKTLLVSAAAGSGKTATLTERIVKSITREENFVDLSRILVVTYTRSAAAEMKEKISTSLADALSAALKENPPKHDLIERLSSQILLLDSAKISTIDAFNYDILKSNFQKIGLPGNLRIAESSEIALIAQAVMESVIDKLYETDSDFESFVDHFADTRTTDGVAKTFISLYEKLRSFRSGANLLLHYADQLEKAADHDFFSTIYGQTATEEICATLNYIRNYNLAAEAYFENDETLSKNYLPSFKREREMAEEALSFVEAGNYEDARATLCSYKRLDLGRISGCDDYTERLKKLRDDGKAKLTKLIENFFNMPPAEIPPYMKKTAEACRIAHRLLTAFDKALSEEKRARGICDFSDISHFTLQLIVDENGDPTPLARELRERFDEIYIDEYQDTNEIQDLIFRSISKENNRFMVGDIKQSIYVYRDADPSLFASYKEKFPPLGSCESNAYSLFMSNNFRCDENIIRFTNLVSSYLFRHCGKSIGYSSKDDLVFTKKPPYEGYVSPNVVMALAKPPKKSKKDKEEAPSETPQENLEARFIVDEIKKLLKMEKADGAKIRPKDIAILMRSRKKMPMLMDMLKKEGIPVCSNEGRNFFENPDVLLLLSLLSTIDNPQRETPLVATLCSPFYNFSLDDLIVIQRDRKEDVSLFDAITSYAATHDNELAQKCADFLDSLSYWRERAKALPVNRLIREIYQGFSVLSMQSANERNLIHLYEYARHFESGGFRGLYSFVRYVTQLIESKTELKCELGGAALDAVQLATIHGSKGLEYTVCFLFDSAKSFSTEFLKDQIQFSPDVGIGFPLHDESGLCYYDTPIRRAVINRISTVQREEEMRILYVAMTRARERLYITATGGDYDEYRKKAQNLSEFGKAYGIIKASSFFDWILAAIEDVGGADAIPYLTIKEIQPKDTEAETDEEKMERAESEEKASEKEAKAPALKKKMLKSNKKLARKLRTRFSFTYPYEHISDLPAKLSVSSLYPAVLDEPTEKEWSDADYGRLLEESFDMPESLSTTKTVSAADRGTATHTFLQFCDFDRVLRTSVAEELSYLISKRFLSADTEKLVNARQLEAFFKSELFVRLNKAKRVYREQRFNLFLPASDFTLSEEKADLLKKETIAVQGVIDLFFEEEDGTVILCDYKTDYLTAEEIKNTTLAAEKLQKRHAQQLSYYAKAIEAMLGKAPDKILIYSLPLGGTVSVKQ